MRVLRFGLALLCLAALLPGRAMAFDGNGCGGPYTHTAKCMFITKGSPLMLRGDTLSSSPHVSVQISIDGYPEVGAIYSCSGGPGSDPSDSSHATCDSGIPDETTGANLPPQAASVFIRMWCTVTGSGSGEYYCQGGQ